MSCFHPLVARRLPDPRDSSKFSVHVEGKYAGPDAYKHLPPGQIMLLPCGQCIFCRLRRSLEWTIRCYHEQQMSGGFGSFITLTFNDDSIKSLGLRLKNGLLTLDHRPFQLFMKRLRKRCGSVRFLMCGEYGSRTERPHYHAILFGFRFPDARPFGKYFRSQILEELWPHGHSVIGNLTHNSISYVCRYNLKKVTGKAAEAHYRGRMPDYVRMSNRPGIGCGWLNRFSGDVYKVDTLTSAVLQDGVRYAGRLSRPPRYYDRLEATSDPVVWAAVQAAREAFAQEALLPEMAELRQAEEHAQYVARQGLQEHKMRELSGSEVRL